MIVLDASCAVDLLLRIQPKAGQISDHLSTPEETTHAPMIFDAEVVQVIRRYLMRGEISIQRAHAAMEDLRLMPIHRYPYLALLPRIWSLRSNLTAFDATYVALAEVLDATFLTSDTRLGRACRQYVSVIVIESQRLRSGP